LFNSFGTSVWWAIVTLTTVGYGDVYPITTAGRITGVVLMFSGVALIGVLAGTLATFFGFGGGGSATSDEVAATTSSDQELEERLVELEQAIAAVRSRLRT
jgi:voltage-gated potassium channel